MMTIYELILYIIHRWSTIQIKIYITIIAAAFILSITQHPLTAQDQKKPQAFRSYESASIPIVTSIYP